MKPELLQRLRWHLRRASPAVVLPALAGVLLLLGAAAGEHWVIAPLASSVDGIRQQTRSLRAQAAQRQRVAASDDPAAQLEEFYRFFPPEASLIDALDRIYAAAEHENIVLAQGDYRLAQESEARLQRYDLTLPLKGRYGAVRRFIAQVLEENPNLALTTLSFSRQSATDIGIDGQLQFTLFLGARP